MSGALTADLLSAYVGIITTAAVSIYAGSFGSLPKSRGRDGEDEDEDEDDSVGRLTSEEAWLFPVLGSVMLVGLFLVLKYLGKEWINWLLSLYFALVGLYSVPHSLISLAKFSLGRRRWNRFSKTSLKVESATRHVTYISCRTPSIYLTLAGVIPSLVYTFYCGPKKPIFLTNLLALSFGHDALSMLKVDSFRTGIILLSGLFFYDIWWVFGTKVMVSVATSLDLPMKILWPKSIAFSTAKGSMMLGLGDIVVPGTFVSLGLRYDHFRWQQHAKKAKAQPQTTFTKQPYFVASLVAYVAGLATTMTVMHVFHAAQPALLYLSPACILSFVFTAWRRGELIEAWRWNDGPNTASKNGATVDKPANETAAVGASSDPSDGVTLRED